MPPPVKARHVIVPREFTRIYGGELPIVSSTLRCHASKVGLVAVVFMATSKLVAGAPRLPPSAEVMGAR